MNPHFKRHLIAAILMSPLGAVSANEQNVQQLQLQIDNLEQRIEAIADTAGSPSMGSSPTTIGGYGELHYNNLENQLAGVTLYASWSRKR